MAKVIDWLFRRRAHQDRIEPAAPAAPEISALGAEDFGLHMGDYWPHQVQGATLPAVTDRSIQRHLTVYAACNIIAQDMAAFPLNVIQREGDQVTPRPDHPAQRLLNAACAPDVPAMVLREMITWRLLLRGNSYAWPERDARGMLSAIWPVEGTVSISEFGRRRFYDFIDPDRAHRRVAAGEMVHVRTRSDDGYLGASPIRLASQGFGVALAEQDFTARHIGNRVPLRGLLEADTAFRRNEEDEKNISNRVRQAFDNPDSHGLPFIPNGLKYRPIGISPADAELIDQRKLTRNEIAAIFRVPPSKLAIADGVQKSTQDGQDREYVRGCLWFWARLVEQAMTNVLFTERELGAGYGLNHDFGSLIEASLPELYAALVTAVGGPILTANEARRRIGAGETPDGERLNAPAHGTREQSEQGESANA
ncbi:MAG: phage portal protein [Pseudomonadota bacterium]